MEQFTPYPIRVSAAIFNKRADLLVVQHRLDDGRTFWTFPGGTPNPGESLHDAIIREVREETGYSIEYAGLLAIAELDASYHQGPTRIEIIFSANVNEDDLAEPRLSDRYLDPQWRTANDLKDTFLPSAVYWAAIDGRCERYLGDITEDLKAK